MLPPQVQTNRGQRNGASPHAGQHVPRPTAVATEALTLDGAALRAGPRLFDIVRHMAPPLVRRPAQRMFSRGQRPHPDLVANLVQQGRWASVMAPSISVWPLTWRQSGSRLRMGMGST